MSYKIEYTDDKVSAWGGFSVMKNFNDKLELKRIINNLPIPKSTSNNRYETLSILQNKKIGLLRADSAQKQLCAL